MKAFNNVMKRLSGMLYYAKLANQAEDHEAVISFVRNADKIALRYCSKWKNINRHTVALLALRFHKL